MIIFAFNMWTLYICCKKNLWLHTQMSSDRQGSEISRSLWLCHVWMKTGGFFPPVCLMIPELLTLGQQHGLTSTAKDLTVWLYITNMQPELQTWHNTSQMSVSGLGSAFDIFLGSKLRAVWPLIWKLIGWKSNLMLGRCCGIHWRWESLEKSWRRAHQRHQRFYLETY